MLGVLVDAVDYEAAVAKIVAAAKTRRRCTVTALAVHGVMTGFSDRVHRHRLNHLDLVVPDGQPVRWGLNSLHSTQLKDRVYGPNLMLKTCEAAAANDFPIFLFGSTDEVLTLLRSNLSKAYPSLQIAGVQASRFKQLTESEHEALAEQILASGAKITFAGIGCPRQEVWAFEMGNRLSTPILAVGAAFAFHAGKLSQAPQWMQDWGLEWFYRFCKIFSAANCKKTW